MELSRTSKLVRFAYWLPWPYSRRDIAGPMVVPMSTSLCGFFWRLLLRPAFLLLLMVIVLPIFGILIGILVGCGTVAMACISGVSPEPRRIVREYIKAKKDRVCPIIMIR